MGSFSPGSGKSAMTARATIRTQSRMRAGRTARTRAVEMASSIRATVKSATTAIQPQATAATPRASARSAATGWWTSTKASSATTETTWIRTPAATTARWPAAATAWCAAIRAARAVRAAGPNSVTTAASQRRAMQTARLLSAETAPSTQRLAKSATTAASRLRAMRTARWLPVATEH